MRVGYSFWGFLGDDRLDRDGNVLSTPDGNATYSWSIIHELQKRGHTVYAMQEDRDRPAVSRYGAENFSSFSREKRWRAYRNLVQTDGNRTPDLDVLLVEWRFPIPGRNVKTKNFGPEHVDYQPDLDRQNDLLTHYFFKGTKIIFWDLDHKLSVADEIFWRPAAVFETSVRPVVGFGPERTRVEPPFCMDDLLQFPTEPADPNKLLAYVGSRYERDEVIDRYVGPVQKRSPGNVHFYGNWTREPNLSECRSRWPGVVYHGRITPKGFREAYRDAVACPLLAKESYLQTGFITPRPWEAVLFGTLPIGLSEMTGARDYCLLVSTPESIWEDVRAMSMASLKQRDGWRRELAENFYFMDARFFVDRLEAA